MMPACGCLQWWCGRDDGGDNCDGVANHGSGDRGRGADNSSSGGEDSGEGALRVMDVELSGSGG